MHSLQSTATIHCRALTLGILATSTLAATTVELYAHGTVVVPPSRAHICRFQDNPENPSIPSCAAAVSHAGTSQFLYDWNGIRQGDADGRHQVVVPDGRLCSGGGPEFAGLDLVRDDWTATPIAPDGDGRFEFIYHATAPHSTRDMLFFITPEGWTPDRALTWEDLDFVDDPGNPNDPIDPFCRLTSAMLETIPGIGDGYRMDCPLPNRTGRHVIYHVWQRDDSPEAFYACIDVVLPGSSIFESGFENGGISEWSLSVP